MTAIQPGQPAPAAAATEARHPARSTEEPMTITRYRKRPVEVDTIRWTGDNVDALIDFTGGDFLLVKPDEGGFAPDVTAKVYDELHDTWVGVKTGQHIVRGVKGEHYPIAEDVLAETYELATPVPAATEATELETTARVLAGLHRSAEQDVTRVIALYEQWVKAGPPPLGVSLSRWWDARLVELHHAIVPAADQLKEQQEQAASVNWQAIAQQRERELRKVGEARQRADTEVRETATALAEALAYLHALTRVGGSVIGYQTVNVIPPGAYDRWCAARDAGAGKAGEQP